MTGKKKILIVDDEAGFAAILKIALEETGEYDVRVETSGLGGFEAARRFRPDLVLMDIRMPDGSGPEIARRVKHSAELKDTPVIFVSATPFEESVKHFDGTLAGCPYITKPAGAEEIMSCIRQVLRNGGNGR